MELSWRARGRLWLRLGLRGAGAALAVAAVLAAGPTLLSLFAPFAAALVLAWLLNPAVRTLQRRLGGSRRGWALVLLLALFAVAGGLVVSLGYRVWAEARSLAESWPALQEGLRGALDGTVVRMKTLFGGLPPQAETWVDRLWEEVMDGIQQGAARLLSHLAAGAGSAAMGLPSFGVALAVFSMGSYFMMADYPHIRYLFVERMTADTLGLLRFVKYTAWTALGGWLRAQLLLSAAVFFLLLAGFALIGQSYALLLALALAVMDFIPIIGSGTVLVPWAAVELGLGRGRHGLELLVIWGIIALFRRLAEPKVVGSQTGLSPILSLMSIYVGMRLGGVAGMILGPVLALVALNICRAGVFDGLAADLGLAARDLRGLLRGGN